MAPARRNISGRSPLVNQQRQITAFFSKNTSATPSPSPSPSPSPNICKQNPNPKSKSSLSPPSSSPTTPSPIQSNLKKPLLVIGQSPLTPDAKLYGEEVLGRRIRVYWPLDQTWYEGVVKSFDKESGSHLVCYDDDEEESLDLGKEKFEWVEEITKFKRLRRGGSLAIKRMVIDDDDEVENVDEKTDGLSGGSSDEDWGKKNEEKEASEDTEEDDMDLVEEKEETAEDEEEDKLGVAEGKRSKKNESLKRKANGGGKQDTTKKSKTSEDASKGKTKVSAMEPVKIFGSK